ncbi:MAG: DUF4912 domain-containing protein [Planctomycetota bacterium]
MITTVDLKTQTRRELAEIARNYGVTGWHGMKKDELLTEIRKVQRRLRRKAAAESKKSAAASPTVAQRSVEAKPSRAASKKTPRTTTKAPASSRKRAPNRKSEPTEDLTKPKITAKQARIRAEMRRRRELVQRHKDLSTDTLVGGSAVTDGSNRHRADVPHRDRVALVVRDAYWLQATWEITRASVQRAQAALAEKWHTAVPTLRLLSIGDLANNRAETVARDIPIHGGVSNWYVDVQDPPSRHRVAIGYLASDGEFFCLARSNRIETPAPGDCERLDEHWKDIAEDYERIYALSGGYSDNSEDLREMFESRLQRSMPHHNESGGTTAEPALLRQAKLGLDVEAELIVFGKTDPTATVMVSGRPVKLQEDGAFTLRLEFPDRRQVLPITAETRDGLRQRTTVIAIERNTKVMDTVELQENV